MYYTIYLNIKESVTEHLLPSGTETFFRADISSAAGRKNCFVSLEKTDGVWRIINDRNILVQGNGIIEPGKCTEFEIKSTVLTGALFVSEREVLNDGFDRFSLSDSITIGSSTDCDITASGRFVSRKHAEIICTEDRCIIKNFSENGIYINGCRAENECQLKMFDTVWIFGLKLVFLGGCIAVQKSSGVVSGINETQDIIYEKGTIRKHRGKNSEKVQDVFSDAEPETAEIFPYEPDNGRNTDSEFSDILKTSVPASAVLSAAAVLGGGFSIPIAATLFAGSTAVISGLWFSARSLSEKNRRKNDEERRNKYILNCLQEIEDKQERYRKLMNGRYPGAEKAFSLFRKNGTKLRRAGDKDFLRLRICTGQSDFSSLIDIKKECSHEIRELSEKYSTVSEMPLTADFRSEKLIHVSGTAGKIAAFIRGLSVQTAVFHSAADVKLAFIMSEEMKSELRFAGWLPHVYDDEKIFRFCSDSDDSAEFVTEKLSEVFRTRAAGRCVNTHPHYIVFICGEVTAAEQMIRKYSHPETENGITFVQCIVTDDDKIKISGEQFRIETDSADIISQENAISLARLKLAGSESNEKSIPVPSSLSFLEMYQYTSTDPENLSHNYSEGKSRNGICALLGVGHDRKPFYLDIHETGYGPHGLIAGTTGSGKSELIQTFILSLALGYSPDELAFVLIDYKGGGMSRVFEKLPHTAGILTNLEDSAGDTDRILVSLSSEIKRRQIVLKNSGVSHIDAYAGLYSDGKADEPLPHVIIVCDEFAELRREQPEFISQLVSISRVGRSLGIHLILATQRPSGVVDDEIKSNSGFRICLKVQDRNDSSEILGKPDAAEITNTGRAYIQAPGIYEEVQTGYSGAEYCMNGSGKNAVMIDFCARPVNVTESNEKTKSITETEMLTDRICRFCSENGIRQARKLWTEPLEKIIHSSDVSSFGKTDFSRGLVFCAGVCDDPENQKMYPAEFNLYDTGNIIAAGMAGSGKTTFVNTLLCSLAENYSPEKLNFSVADFSGGMLSVFSEFAHCSRFLSVPDEHETKLFLDEISRETEKRKKRFSEVHAADFAEYTEEYDDMCAQVILMDGYGLFREMYPLSDELFTRLAGESVKYGIYFIVTVKQASDIRMRTRQNFRTAVTFELSDRTEYTELLGIRPETGLLSVPGRGYLVSDRRVLVFQTAVYSAGKGRERFAQLSEFAERINKKYGFSLVSEDRLFCRTAEVCSADGYIQLAVEYAEKGEVYLWGSDLKSDSAKYECFSGADGAYELLLKLADIFTRRNTARKISGQTEWENLTVVLCGLDSFCSCIYSEGREDMASVTEKFFEGGSGLGVRFLTGREENPLNADRRAYRLFTENTEGGAVC